MLPSTSQLLTYSSHNGIWERNRKVTVKKAMGGDKDGLLGKAKAVQAKKNALIHYYLSAGRCLATFRKIRLITHYYCVGRQAPLLWMSLLMQVHSPSFYSEYVPIWYGISRSAVLAVALPSQLLALLAGRAAQKKSLPLHTTGQWQLKHQCASITTVFITDSKHCTTCPHKANRSLCQPKLWQQDGTQDSTLLGACVALTQPLDKPCKKKKK